MMKHLAAIGCLIALSTGAYAQSSESTARQGANADSASVSTSGANSTNAGNSQAITFTSPAESTTNVHYSGDQKIKNVPSVSGPPLTTSNDTCMGSSSASVNAAGFGVGIGSTWTDDNCKLLKNSRELWNMGMKAAAMALMCLDPLNRTALQQTGYVCPGQVPVGTPQSAAAPTATYSGAYTGTDPIVRARLGLPPLK